MWRTTGHLVEDVPRINISFVTKSNVFPFFISAVDVKHVCTGQAAETRDLVKATTETTAS